MGQRYYPRVTVDAIIEKDDRIALVKRAKDPYKGMWAIPGGHVDASDKDTKETAVREAREETGLDVEIEYVLDDNTELIDDPRGDFINVAYVCSTEQETLEPDTDAEDAKWFDLDDIPEKLAFRQERVIEKYRNARRQ